MKQVAIGIIILLTGYIHVFSQEDKIDKYVKEEMQQNHIPGMSVVVVSQGKVVFSKEYGLANVELSVPVTSSM